MAHNDDQKIKLLKIFKIWGMFFSETILSTISNAVELNLYVSIFIFFNKYLDFSIGAKTFNSRTLAQNCNFQKGVQAQLKIDSLIFVELRTGDIWKQYAAVPWAEHDQVLEYCSTESS